MQKHRYSFMSRSLAVLVTLALLGLAPSVLAEEQHQRFAPRVAGTYLTDGIVVFGGLTALITINRDGNFSMEDTSDYGGGRQRPVVFQSDQRGSWRKSGPNQISWLTLGFDFDADGTWVGGLRIRGTITFDSSFDNISSEWVVEGFDGSTADMLGDEPIVVIPGTFTARRIPAVLP